ncbi:hypothetical protein DPEC_G00185600 [Dallia pectoralis]|uniref:Uncharacterized protein n=1 Tax=Dallia pectoralis TaxID=75939 RepID=A0ACC2GBE7_DALPE|nr:hypothetical protein DPEC_G00185600 [Dallia pectoralis]
MLGWEVLRWNTVEQISTTPDDATLSLYVNLPTCPPPPAPGPTGFQAGSPATGRTPTHAGSCSCGALSPSGGGELLPVNSKVLPAMDVTPAGGPPGGVGEVDFQDLSQGPSLSHSPNLSTSLAGAAPLIELSVTAGPNPAGRRSVRCEQNNPRRCRAINGSAPRHRRTVFNIMQ